MIRLTIKDQKNSLNEREAFFNLLKRIPPKNSIILNTCNRVELYEGEGEISREIVHHLFRVVSGLEATLIGETAIQGQVKKAYQTACKNQEVSSGLHRLFQRALYVGKRVRSETTISKGAISHSQAAVMLLLSKGIDLEKSTITLVGVHNLNERIVAYLAKKGAKTIFLANKTFQKARNLAEKYDCQALRLTELSEKLWGTDVLITATASPHCFIRYKDFPRSKEMIIIDLAVPRDVEAEIGNISGVELFNITDIERHVEQNTNLRKKEIVLAEKIIEGEVAEFIAKLELIYA